ncbi:MAG: purine-nucleoside phosphorylase [Coriobacteriia bacterium]|nr:purine-nucleoside phosphorylase [Coriobacteriia bacterium]
MIPNEHWYEELMQAVRVIKSKTELVPQIGVILGSGLGSVADALEDAVHIPYSEIPHMPQSTAPGHAGELVIGKLHGKVVAFLKGRVHLYEGYSPQEVVFATRLLHLLQVKSLIITNAAGGIREDLHGPSVMIADDHINFQGQNPLVGQNIDELGERFPDMRETYSLRLRDIADKVVNDLKSEIPVAHGVYISVLGPSFETPAEIRAFRALGADAVGMSSVPEAIAAHHMGLDVLMLSTISNAAAGLSDEVLNVEHTLNQVAKIAPFVQTLIQGIIAEL